MRKLLICCAACLMGVCAMAQTEEINAVSATQNNKTDWFSFGDKNSIIVTVNDAGDPVFPNKNYSMANGNLMTAFGSAPTGKWVTLRTNVVPNNLSTICLEKNTTATNGATFWNVVSETDSSFVLEQVSEPKAGYGYIVYYTDSELKVQYGNEVAYAPVKATAEHPIQGLYDAIEDYDPDIMEALMGNYFVYLDLLYLVMEWITIPDHSAYVIANLAPEQAPTPTEAPRITVSKSGKIVDALGEVTDRRRGETVIKVLKDDQLFLRQGEKTYNVLGQEL